MLKRLIDIVVSLIFLIIFFPFLVILFILVRVNIGKPVLFSQPRLGYNNKSFDIIKFRTMTNATDENGQLLPDEERLTAFGSFLRSTSLDELPEIWNVLKGEMSLVGPRPFIIDYLPLYNREQIRRHDVRPGVTGWAQVNGRNAISWEEKFEYDLWYVDNHSFWVDLKILFLTAKKVFKREGISAQDHVTIERFTGSKNQEQ